MKKKIFQTLERFSWQQWLLVVLFLFVVGFTGWRAVRTVRSAVYWSHHRDEPIHGWMTVRYVAHSYRVPPHVLYEALGVQPQPRDRRPLRGIAKAQHKSLDEVRTILQKAIAQARSSPSPAPSPSANPRGTP
jgi:hypothetical protein